MSDDDHAVCTPVTVDGVTVITRTTRPLDEAEIDKVKDLIRQIIDRRPRRED